MVGQLDQISRAMGSIEAKVDNIERRAEEDRALGDTRHAENKQAISTLTAKLDKHAVAVALQPGLWMSKRRMTGLASIGIAALGGAGLAAEALFKFGFNWLLTHLR